MSGADHFEIERDLVEALPMAVAVFDRDRRLRSYNSPFIALWQLPAEWLAELPTLDDWLERLRQERRLPDEADFRAYKARWSDRFGGNSPTSEDIFLPDGKALRALFKPLSDGGVVIAFEDRSEHLAMARAQHEAVAVQRAALDHLGDGIAVFAADGRLNFHNAAVRALFNVVEADLVDRPHLREMLARVPLLAPSDSDQNRVGRLISRAPGTENWRLEGDRTLSVSHVPLPDGATMLHLTDITTAAQTTNALQARADDLAAVAHLKSTFLAHLSSELRTPLNTISGFAQLLAGNYFGDLNKRQQEYSDGIAETADKLAGLLSDIVDLANIEAGLLDIERQPSDLHALLVSVLELVRGRARDRKVVLGFDCSPEIGWVEVDARRIKQALLHLLNNALSFTSAGGRVTLSATRETSAVTITVADTGVGIPKADQERLRKPFQRGADTTDGGAGLGLSVVDQLISLHGGKTEIVSRAGRGTTVTCWLPEMSDAKK